MKNIKSAYMLFTIWILFSLLIPAFQAEAQWVEQIITLEPGWNSIYLEVDPQPNQCDKIFKDLPVASVWAWNHKSSPVEYIQNPDTLLPKDPRWMVYFPSTTVQSVLTNLHIIMGGKAYLIKIKGDKTITWSVIGRPCIPKISWKPDSYNLVGFHLSSGDEPFFGSFFSASPSHIGQAIYRLNEEETWEKVAYPSITAMKQGEAYWVYCKGISDYTGPMNCQVEQGTGLEYGRTLVEQTFRIRNLSTQEANIALRSVSSENPLDENQLPVAGDVLLSYWKYDLQANDAGWRMLPDPLSLILSSGQEKSVRLAVNRSSMASTGLCQSVLEVKNTLGVRMLVPVSAKGSGQGNETLSKARFRDPATIRHIGLWVGNALIKGVSQPADPLAPDDPNKPTASEFQFRLLIHVDAEGRARLLKEVTQMWKEGTWKDDPEDPTKQIVDEPGHFVLLTDDSLIFSYTGAGLRSGEPVGRRISSATFSFTNPIVMEGAFSMNGKLSCSFTIEPDDPLNPFKHKYHPDHDNLDEHRVEYREEAYRITRQIELEFTNQDPMVPEEAQAAGWGDTYMGGIYRETITGLHRKNIHTKGFFFLHRVSPVAYLNDGRPLN